MHFYNMEVKKKEAKHLTYFRENAYVKGKA